MRIAITGAGGILGSMLLHQAAARADVMTYALTSRANVLRARYTGKDNVRLVDPSALNECDFSKVDVLIQGAFPRDAQEERFASGLEFGQRVLSKAVGDGVGAVINISSQSVYGSRRTEAVDESAGIVLEDKYAVGKYAMELMTNALCCEIPHSNIRLASLIGTSFEQRFVNKMIDQVIAGNQLCVAGGEQRFGFLDVRDAANGILTMALGAQRKWQEVYNLGHNDGYTLNEIARCIYDVGKKLGYPTAEIQSIPAAKWQNSELICDLFYDTFGWRPRYRLQDTVIDIFEAKRRER